MLSRASAKIVLLPLSALDSLRAQILKRTLAVPLFRQIFLTRSQRLLLFFLISTGISLVIALKAPLWSLLIAPLVLGVPHLMASLRYVPRLVDIERHEIVARLPIWLGAFFVAMAALRFGLETYNPLALKTYPNLLELGGCAFAVIFIGWLSRHNPKRVLSAACLLSPLIFFSLACPFETLGFLVLLHNFVAFIFWLQRAGSKRDRISPLVALVIFSLVTLLILGGAFDNFITDRDFQILDGSLNDASLGAMVFPHASLLFWHRVVSAYAFGQGLHYYVWLKAIPEQELPHDHPVGFAKSARLLKIDLGKTLVGAGILSTAGIILFGLLKTFPEARLLYLSGAAFHGYFEIAGLPFITASSHDR